MSKQEEQFCIKCGKALPVGSSFCNHCGANQFGASEQVAPAAPTVIYANQVANSIPPFSAFCVAGFVTAIFQLSPFNLIFSIIGVHECKKYGKRGMGLGVFSIIFSLLDIIVITVIMLAILGFSAITLPFGISDYVTKSKEAEESIKEHNEQVQVVVDEIDSKILGTTSFWDQSTSQSTEYNQNPGFLSKDDAYDLNDYCKVNSYYTDEICSDGFGNTYEPDYVFTVTDAWLEDKPARARFYVAKKYNCISGTIYVPYCSIGRSSNDGSYVRIYGDDDELLYESVDPVGTSEPVEFSVDISGNDFVVIEIDGGWFYGDGTGRVPYLCVTNVELSA